MAAVVDLVLLHFLQKDTALSKVNESTGRSLTDFEESFWKQCRPYDCGSNSQHNLSGYFPCGISFLSMYCTNRFPGSQSMVTYLLYRAKTCLRVQPRSSSSTSSYLDSASIASASITRHSGSAGRKDRLAGSSHVHVGTILPIFNT